ncbi:MAG: hypothetical protein IJI22_02330 [Bacilli bacterium]|nr:hypothetical protein [Bacilli bacterium]
MNISKYEDEAIVYLNSDKTIAETANDIGISKRTLQLHLGKIEDINPELYKLLLAKKKLQMKQGRIKGGTIGKRGTSHSEEEIRMIAETMIKEELSYAEAEIKFSIPKSTIYELLHKPSVPIETRNMLDTLADANQKNMTIAEYIESKRRN